MSYAWVCGFHPHEILEYQTQNGSIPFRTWLHSLKRIEVRAHVRARLNRIRLGNFGDCRALGDGVHELRIDCGPGYRVYFGHVGRRIVLLLTGGAKSSQVRDIAKARDYLRDYERRTP